MNLHTTSWEDDDCSRVVELSVEYRLDGRELQIERVTPQAVRFLEKGGVPERKIRIWTETAREMLLRQHAARVGQSALRQQIEAELAAGVA